MIIIKSPREIKLMREAGVVVGEVFAALETFIKPGVSTLEISELVEKVMVEHGAKSAEKGYCGYPAAACVSVNEELVHGIPSAKRILRDGDIVSVDIVAEKNGFLADACRTYAVGICGERQKRIIDVTTMCFDEAMKLIKPGVHLGDISHRIESVAKENGYQVAREYTGHGIGSNMHEDPYIPNYGNAGEGPILREGMTLCFEPMLLEGKNSLRILKDGWTAVAKDGKLTCHYENTIVVTSTGFEILTMLEKEKKERGYAI